MDYYDLIKEHLPAPTGQADEEVAFRCPFHKGGQEKTPSFYFNRSKGTAFCHKCHQGWNVLTLLKDLGVVRWKRDALVDILKQHGLFSHKSRCVVLTRGESSFLPEAVLGLFDNDNDYMLGRGYPPELLTKLDIGYDPDSNRVSFPVRSEDGRLLAVAGRAVNGDALRYQWFKEVFQEIVPGYAPEASSYLWGLETLYPKAKLDGRLDRIVLVEGYMQRLRLLQYGYENVVAVLGGAGMSRKQVRLLYDCTDQLVLFFDLDEGGMALIGRALEEAQGMDLRIVVDWPEDEDGNAKTQPDHFTPEEVDAALDGAMIPNRARRKLKMDHSLLVQRHVKRESRGSGKKSYTDNELKRRNFQLNVGKTRPVKIFPVKYEMVDPCSFEPTFGQPIGWFPVRGHTRWFEGKGDKKGDMHEIVCSAGWDEEEELPCNGCYEYDDKGFEGPVSRKLWRCLAVLVDEPFHREKKTGRKGTKYERIYLCHKMGCNACKSGIEKFHGRLMYLIVQGKQWKQFLELCALANNLCGECGEPIMLTGVACQACEETILEGDAWDEVPDAERQKYLISPLKCPHCENVDLPGGLYECESDCDEAEPADVWGVRTTVRRTEGGYSFGDPKVKDLPDELIAASEPLDFFTLFPPDTLEDQASVLRIDNHFDAA